MKAERSPSMIEGIGKLPLFALCPGLLPHLSAVHTLYDSTRQLVCHLNRYYKQLGQKEFKK